MMTPDQQKTVLQVYRRFVESDLSDTEWTDVDEAMSMLEWIDDSQLVKEASVKIMEHMAGTPKCNQYHGDLPCFVPTIIEASTYIVDLYNSTENLHPKNRFILQYYLALSQVGFILK